MASLEMVSTQMFECVTRDRNKKEKDLKVLVRDQFDNFRVFPVDDSRSNQDGKSKEGSSRSSVSETEDSLPTLSSNSNPTSSQVETNSNPSRNEIIMGASSLVQIWEARSQQSSPSQNQSLIDSRTSSGLSFSENSNSSSNEDDKEADWCLESNISESCEKEREGRYFLPLVRIRGRQAFEYFLMMILCDRKNELKWLASLYAVSKFSPRGCGRLQYMLMIRSYERCNAIRERHLLKSAKRSLRGPGVMNLSDRSKTNTGKPKIAKKAILSEDTRNENGLKKPEVERKATEGPGETIEKGTVMASVEANNASLSIIAEKVNLWDSKERNNRSVEAREVNKEEVSSFEERKSMEIEEYRIDPQEVISVISSEKIQEEENVSQVSREEIVSKDDGETLGQILVGFLNGWDENDLEYSRESLNYDWVSDISRPRSYWDHLRKQRELEVMDKLSKKDDIFLKLIKERTVSSFLASDFREDMEKILIQKRLQLVESIHADEEASEEWLVDCTANETTEKVDLETGIVCDGFSQTSPNSTSFEVHDNTSYMICDLREDIKNLQREMLQLKGLLKTCVDFQILKSVSVSDSLQRNCSVCFDKPIDSLLYRCGHMCTCLKCGHELQWSTKKCPICMAPILDVVRAFLDS